MIKVDLRKAYDSLEWSFLESMLDETSPFVKWVMDCVTTVSYLVHILFIPCISRFMTGTKLMSNWQGIHLIAIFQGVLLSS